MKRIRGLAVMALVLVLMFTFTGCVVIPLGDHYYDYDPETVVSVEIYDLRGSLTTTDSFLETDVPVYTVTEEQKTEFLADLGQIQFEDYIFIVLAAYDPSFDYGEWAIRINRADGSYVLHSNGGYAKTYDKNNKLTNYHRHSQTDQERWGRLMEKYVPLHILLMSPEHNANAMARR